MEVWSLVQQMTNLYISFTKFTLLWGKILIFSGHIVNYYLSELVTSMSCLKYWFRGNISVEVKWFGHEQQKLHVIVQPDTDFQGKCEKNLFPYIKIARSFLLHWQSFFVEILNTTNYGIATFGMILISSVTFPCYIQTWFSKRFDSHFTLPHAYETVQYLKILSIWKHMYSFVVQAYYF